MTPDVADAWGLGLSYGTVRLVTTPPEWHAAAARLIAPVCSVLGSDAIAVEHIGSTAVVGLLAKPIIDIAVLLAPEVNRDTVIATIESLGYEYRGDAGGEGGLAFVLDARPRVRVAHLHVIAHGDPQWDRYLAFVERLRTDPDAHAAYGGVKQQLAAAHPDGRQAYTNGKSDIVEHLVTRPRSG